MQLICGTHPKVSYTNGYKRALVGGKSQAIAAIESIVRDVIDELYRKQMDRMVNSLRKTEPDFVNEYFMGREILDLGSTSAKLRGTVKDPNDVPLVGVKVQIFKTGTQELVGETTSVQKGYFSIKKIPAGNYDFQWTFNNYQDVTETNVHIIAGKETQRKVTMYPTVTEHFEIAAGAIVILDDDVEPTDHPEAKVKNTSPAGTVIHLYFSSSPTEPFPGTGVTLQPGEERTITVADLGSPKPFILAQNPSTAEGGLDVTTINPGV